MLTAGILSYLIETAFRVRTEDFGHATSRTPWLPVNFQGVYFLPKYDLYDSNHKDLSNLRNPQATHRIFSIKGV
jgi:hypothetical protein